jgi:methionyl-tRNA synthetase
MYVWFDALTNYLTAVGYPDDEPRFSRYWPADIHLMGKEIVRQHTVYWPAFLMAAGLDLPRRVIGHGWWLMNEAKMSKSLGNVVQPQGYVDRFGVDALRYFVLREMVVGQDANFADDTFLARYNADLANDLGNAVSRITTMIQRYCGGVVPEPSAAVPGPPDVELIRSADETIRRAKHAAGMFDLSSALREIWSLIAAVNRYVVTREPWVLARSPESRELLDTTLYNAADVLRIVAALVEPVMPSTTGRILRMLGAAGETWAGLKPGTLKAGATLGPIEPLFPRMEHTVDELRRMADTGAAAPTPADASSSARAAEDKPVVTPSAEAEKITIDDFMKVDLRVAKVLAAEKVPNSRKLVKLSIDAGTEQRTLVAGIAEAYEPEQLVGRTIVMVFNLKPAKLMGIESNGMVLAASPDGGKPTLVGFDAEVPPGTRVR